MNKEEEEEDEKCKQPCIYILIDSMFFCGIKLSQIGLKKDFCGKKLSQIATET